MKVLVKTKYKKLFEKYKILIVLETILFIIIVTFFYKNNPSLNIFIYLISMLITWHISSKVSKEMAKKRLLKEVETKTREIHLKDQKRKDIILEAGRLASWQLSVSAGILKLDHNALRVIGENKIYYTFEELYSIKDLKEIIDSVESGSPQSIDKEVFVPKLGKWFIVRGRVLQSKGVKPNHYVGVIFDNTERRNYRKKLEHLSTTDELTGLKNRRYFFEHFNREIIHYSRSHSRFTLALFDLDHFKAINDTYGHITGDRVLKHFSNLVYQEVRPYDLVARYGGEEFVVLFPDICKTEASNIVNRIKVRLKENPCIFEDRLISYTFSCGIGDSNELGLCTEKEFVSIIDERLYKAKNSGRNLIITGG